MLGVLLGDTKKRVTGQKPSGAPAEEGGGGRGVLAAGLAGGSGRRGSFRQVAGAWGREERGARRPVRSAALDREARAEGPPALGHAPRPLPDNLPAGKELQVPGPRNPGLRHPTQPLCQRGPARIATSRDTDPLASRGRAPQATWRRGGDNHYFGTWKVCFRSCTGEPRTKRRGKASPPCTPPPSSLREKGRKPRRALRWPRDGTQRGARPRLAAGHVAVTWAAERAPGVSAGLPAPSAAHARARPTWGRRRRLGHPLPGLGPRGSGPAHLPSRTSLPPPRGPRHAPRDPAHLSRGASHCGPLGEAPPAVGPRRYTGLSALRRRKLHSGAAALPVQVDLQLILHTAWKSSSPASASQCWNYRLPSKFEACLN